MVLSRGNKVIGFNFLPNVNFSEIIAITSDYKARNHIGFEMRKIFPHHLTKILDFVDRDSNNSYDVTAITWDKFGYEWSK